RVRSRRPDGTLLPVVGGGIPQQYRTLLRHRRDYRWSARPLPTDRGAILRAYRWVLRRKWLYYAAGACAAVLLSGPRGNDQLVRREFGHYARSRGVRRGLPVVRRDAVPGAVGREQGRRVVRPWAF